MKEKHLYFILTILIIFASVVISIVALNKKLNINKDDIFAMLKDVNWIYTKSDFYNTNNESSSSIINDFSLNIYETHLKICFGEICMESEYVIDKDTIIINSIDGFKGNNKIYFENKNLVLEHYFDDGSKMVYYFKQSK